VNTTHDQRKARKDRNADFGFPGSAAFAFLVYVIITLALTWPVVRGITRDVPSDLGDPLFAMWVMSWDATHLGAGWWNANIFYPHPLALAYSEHFLPQALPVLPIYLVTKNPILCYNLVFLSSFALSGLGMFLFARELTGSREGAFVAGLAYAFAPYRIASLPHLQVLSSAWLPFVLFGFRRYFSTGMFGPLVGAAIAWVVQNLSCGYYFLYFSPVIALYVAWEITVRRLWKNARVLGAIGAAGAATATLTVPFMLPYLALRDLGFSPRDAREIDRFAADVYSYLTAAPNLLVWGTIARAWPKPESALFPGITVVALAAVAGLHAWREARFAAWFTAAAVAAKVILLALLFGWTLRLPLLQIASFGRTVLVAAALAVAALAWSREVRSPPCRLGRASAQRAASSSSTHRTGSSTDSSPASTACASPAGSEWWWRSGLPRLRRSAWPRSATSGGGRASRSSQGRSSLWSSLQYRCRSTAIRRRTSGRGLRRCRTASTLERALRRSIASSRASPRRPRWWNCRWANRRSTSATCSTRPCTGSRWSTAIAAVRRPTTRCWTPGCRTSPLNPIAPGVRSSIPERLT
jgi:hypothetical protein